jgi:hypothetical protein
MNTANLATASVGPAAPIAQVTVDVSAAGASDPRGRLLRALAGPANTSPFHRRPHRGPRDRSSARHRHALADPQCENRRD